MGCLSNYIYPWLRPEGHDAIRGSSDVQTSPGGREDL